MSFVPLIGDLIGGVGKIIDNLHTSDDERLQAREKLSALQIQMQQAAMEHEAALVSEASQTVRSEAASSHWLAANWRPLVMLFLTALVGAHWLGFTPEGLAESEILGLLDIVQLGLGGYVIGRSVEKTAPAVVAAMKK